MGHVNNAALWTALTEVAGSGLSSAALTHHGSVDAGQTVTLASQPGRMALVVESDVRVSAEYSSS